MGGTKIAVIKKKETLTAIRTVAMAKKKTAAAIKTIDIRETMAAVVTMAVMAKAPKIFRKRAKIVAEKKIATMAANTFRSSDAISFNR